MNLLLLFLGLLIILFLIAFFFWGLKKAFFLALNSIIGYFALFAVQYYWLESLKINFVSILLTAIFGIIGFIIVLLLHLLHVAF